MSANIPGPAPTTEQVIADKERQLAEAQEALNNLNKLSKFGSLKNTFSPLPGVDLSTMRHLKSPFDNPMGDTEKTISTLTEEIEGLKKTLGGRDTGLTSPDLAKQKKTAEVTAKLARQRNGRGATILTGSQGTAEGNSGKRTLLGA